MINLDTTKRYQDFLLCYSKSKKMPLIGAEAKKCGSVKETKSIHGIITVSNGDDLSQVMLSALK